MLKVEEIQEKVWGSIYIGSWQAKFAWFEAQTNF